MKKVLLTAAVISFLSLPAFMKAQDVKQEKSEKAEKAEKAEKKEKNETQEIIIRNRGGKDMKLKVEINGDEITVNGKPLAEFKDDQVVINKRKMMIRDRGDGMVFNYSPDAMVFDKNFMHDWAGEGKTVIKPFLGVTTEKTDEGAKVTEVSKASAAEKAGLKEGDIITKVGDKQLTDEDGLGDLIAERKPKEVVKITFLRNGKESNVKATLGERKVSGAMAYAFGPKGNVRSFSMPKISETPNMEFFKNDDLAGVEHLAPSYNFDSYSFSRQKKIGLKIQDTDEGGNVKIIDVEEGSAAEKAGLKKDDVITEIGGKKVTNTDEAREQLNPAEAKPSYPVKALRNGTEMNFEIKIPKKLKTANL